MFRSAPFNAPIRRPTVELLMLYSPGMNRFFSLVAMAAVLPLLALYAILMRASMPGPYSGMEPTVAMICYFAYTFIFGALIVVCINFSRQLSRQARGETQTP